jgi:Do/DeqQ family serine protease
VAAPAAPTGFQSSFNAVANLAQNAVVNITSRQEAPSAAQPFFYGDPNDFLHRFFGREKKEKAPPVTVEATGSGFLIDPDGYILTNAHVVKGSDALVATTRDGKRYDAILIGLDDQTDLAVIRIKHAYPAPYLRLGDSSKLRIGDWVLAMGSPFGLEQTATTGIISARRQTLTVEGKLFRELIQTDAAINRGNSGGPLLNIWGEVVGINTAIYAPTGVFSGIGFAIPANQARGVLRDLLLKGHVERSWIGVALEPVTDILAHEFGLPKTEGALVNDVLAGTPAATAGIRRGDVIVSIDGKPISLPADMQDRVTGLAPGTAVRVGLIRDGKPAEFTVKTEAAPSEEALDRRLKGPPAAESALWLGASIADIDGVAVRKFDLAPEMAGRGVLVTAVEKGSEAAEAGLRRGDVILSVNRSPVASVRALEDLEKIDLKKGVVFDLVRKGKPLYLSYRSAR